MTDDAQLLRRFAEEHSQEAFAELVHRHVNLVYFAALRRVGGDAHLADDITQGVFADLARKASALTDRPTLAGWLHTSTRYAAAQAVRGEQRRRTHELEAQTMHELHGTAEPDWERLRPVLDAALDDLSEPEREALLLRFFEDRPFAEVGARFALSPDAARMRVERALEKLRGLLARRGIASTSAALAAIFAAQSGLAAPAGLAARVMAGALGATGAAGVPLAAWKILAGLAAGALGLGLVLRHQNQSEVGPPMTAAAHSPADGEKQAVAIAPVPHDVAAPAARAALPVIAAPQPAAAVGKGFELMTEKEKDILKRLWDHYQAGPPDNARQHWAFRPGPETADAALAEFADAADQLATDGLVGVASKNGMVFLTNKGRLFCEAHANELADRPAKPGISRRLNP